MEPVVRQQRPRAVKEIPSVQGRGRHANLFGWAAACHNDRADGCVHRRRINSWRRHRTGRDTDVCGRTRRCGAPAWSAGRLPSACGPSRWSRRRTVSTSISWANIGINAPRIESVAPKAESAIGASWAGQAYPGRGADGRAGLRRRQDDHRGRVMNPVGGCEESGQQLGEVRVRLSCSIERHEVW